MNFKNYLILFTFSLTFFFHNGANAQSLNRVSQLVEDAKKMGTSFQSVTPFIRLENKSLSFRNENIEYEVFKLEPKNLSNIITQKPDAITLPLTFQGKSIYLEMVKVDLYAQGFHVTTSSGSPFFDRSNAQFYRGVIRGNKNSVAAISFLNNQVIGVIDSKEDGNLVFGKLKNSSDNEFILYNLGQINETPDFSCDVETMEEISSQVHNNSTNYRVENCVNVYLECEHDFYTEEGSVQNTVDQMTGIFNVVSTVYANEAITTKISQIKVWDTPDTYSTSSTSNALNSFRSQNPSFNGDLAHLVSRGAPSGGGVAWVNALCSSYGYAYSYIYNYYNQLPTYSWTVNVIAHEMGHNLGSFHTHDCVWNGNNTAIDGCGPTAGYAGNGSCPTAPVPSNGGTVMSYCHLLSGVGINPSNGFGPQPGDLIRTRITNASCLSSCGSCTSEGLACDDGDDCTTGDVYDANCNCIGTPEPDDDGDGICNIKDQCPGLDDSLIGTSCDDGDICTLNDTYDSNCGCVGTYADSDGDGVCDGLDVCPGFDDKIDTDGDGIPDGCDNNCTIMSDAMDPNPLVHSGSGANSSSLIFSNTSQDINFTISDIGNRTSGNPNNRYIESVTVTYTDENGATQAYGTFNGNQGSTYTVNITDRAQAIFVSLSDSYDGNAPTISVDISAVIFCEDDNTCISPDADGDGVCDANDICPGFDDTIDSDNDGIPDGCDNCNNVSYNISPNPLTLTGSGTSISAINFGTIVNGITFSINDLNSKLNGKADRRFIDQVTVSYIDGNGSIQNYGVFQGNNTNQVSVSIASAQSVSIELSDALDGNAQSAQMSVSMSGIDGCSGGAAALALGGSSIQKTLKELGVYPNPARDMIAIEYVNNQSQVNQLELKIFNLEGRVMHSEKLSFAHHFYNSSIDVSALNTGIYFIQIKDGENIESKKLVILK